MLRRILLFINRHLNKVYIAAFFILSTGLIFMLGYENITGIPTKSVEIFENRNLAKFPDFSEIEWYQTPEKLDAFFSDNLPLRTVIIRFYRRLMADCLPPLLNPIIKGSDGHKFSRISILHYRGYNPLPYSQLNNYRIYLSGINAFWKYHGAVYFCFYVPDKPSVYSENLLEWVGEDKGWTKQITEYLQDMPELGVSFYDLTPVLRENLAPERLLFNKESDLLHWNGNGIEVAYNFIKDKIRNNPAFTADIAIKPYTITTKEIALSTRGSETVPWMSFNPKNLTLLENPYQPPRKGDWGLIDIVENSKIEKGTLLLVTDSCLKKTHQDKLPDSSSAIFPLAHNVHRQVHMHYSHGSFALMNKLAENEKPDIVIDEFVEWVCSGYGAPARGKERFFLAGEMILNEKEYIIDPVEISRLLPADSISSKLDKVIEIKAAGAEETVIQLPELTPDSKGHISVVAKLYIPDNTQATLYYSQEENENIPPEKVIVYLSKGVNYLFIPLYTDSAKPLRATLHLENKGGNYKVYPYPTTPTAFFKEDN